MVNFGVSGYSTAQEYVMLESTAARYRPDLVLLQFTNANDVKNNSAALEEVKGRPYFTLSADGSLRADMSFTGSSAFQGRRSLTSELGRHLADYSRVVQLARAVKEGGIIPRAQMLGVRRPSVTVVAGMLQRAGLIRYQRGRIRIVNRAALEGGSCECYETLRQEFARLQLIP